MSLLSLRREKKLLQTAILIGSIVPVAAGFTGAAFGTLGLFGGGIDPLIDNHFRYLSGILLAIGLAFLSFIPNIETKTHSVRLLTFVVFIGGLARLADILGGTAPDMPVILALVMELAVTPLLCLWQGRIAMRFLKEQQ